MHLVTSLQLGFRLVPPPPPPASVRISPPLVSACRSTQSAIWNAHQTTASRRTAYTKAAIDSICSVLSFYRINVFVSVGTVEWQPKTKKTRNLNVTYTEMGNTSISFNIYRTTMKNILPLNRTYYTHRSVLLLFFQLSLSLPSLFIGVVRYEMWPIIELTDKREKQQAHARAGTGHRTSTKRNKKS